MLCGWGGITACRSGGKYWQPTAGWITYGHLQADCLYTGISYGPNARYSVWQSLDIYVLLRVCMSVCPSHISRRTCPKFTQFSASVAQSSSDDNAVCWVLPVLWSTSCFHITGHMWCTARLTAEGCQSAGGNAERGGADALKLRPSLQHFRSAPLRCLLLTDIPRL